MADQLSLEILIRTIADARGIQTTDAEVKKLSGDLTAAAQAGKPLEMSADSIAQKLTSAGDAAKATAPAVGSVASAVKTTGEAAHATSEQFGKLREGGRGVSEMFRGVEEASAGGTRGLIGLLSIGRGLLGLFRSIGSVLMGPVGLALGAAAAGIAYMGKVARENQAAVEKIFADAAKGSADLKANYDVLEKAAKKSLELQIADVAKLSGEFDRLIAGIDKGAESLKKFRTAQTDLDLAKLDRAEQAALATATTPEARQKISATFDAQRGSIRDRAADTGRDDEAFLAAVKRNQAETTISEQGRLIDAARTDARLKREAADEAISLARAAAGGDGGFAAPGVREAQAKAKEAAKAAALADENFAKVNSSGSTAIEAAQKQIEMANDMKKIVVLQAETVALQREANAQKKVNEKTAKATADTSGVQSQIDATAGDKAALEEQLRRMPGLSTEPEKASLVAAIAAKSDLLEKQNTALLALQADNNRAAAENAQAQLALAKENKSALAQQARQTTNVRSTVY